ncbi:hypothetical protein HHI36_010496 [Cryptolaemus montrouzieri]|uniref:Uncharacterized protein n=1 Tax=Cryptolaemus montrouzieri TaxID=559131 RepID=A0ABD2MIX0_9CUCU
MGQKYAAKIEIPIGYSDKEEFSRNNVPIPDRRLRSTEGHQRIEVREGARISPVVVNYGSNKADTYALLDDASDDEIVLPESEANAFRRLKCTERKMDSNG